MAILQVKHLPDDLYAALRHRAEAGGTTLSEFVTRLQVKYRDARLAGAALRGVSIVLVG